MMKSIASVLLTFLLLLSPSLHAQDAGQQAFADAVTKAINTKDKEALYSLVCYDGMDEAWKKMGLQGFDGIFALADAGRTFTISFEAPDPEKLKPRPFKDGQIAYNLEVTSVCVIHWSDTETNKNTAVNLNLGQKDGKTLISVYVPKK